MRICITCDGISADHNAVLAACDRLGITVIKHAHMLVDPQYWICSFECEPSPAVTWLLLQYSDSLTVY